MKNEKYKFFQHRECEFFPCHQNIKEEEFNCLFCFCPLYALGSGCGGNFEYMENGTKDCSKCILPHVKGSYEFVCGKWDDIAELATENGPEGLKKK